MPTIQEIIAKRNELQKTNPNATNVDARNALSSTTPVQNPPVVPPQQTTPPQTVTGVNGEQFQVAPINPQTGLSQPTTDLLQPAQTEQDINKKYGGFIQDNGINSRQPLNNTVGQIQPAKEVKTEVPIDYNVSAGREQDIQKNIADITKANPALLKDRNAYNQAFGYSTADPGKKALLDSAFQGANQPMNQKDVLNAFISGVSVPEQNTQAYRNAKVQYDTFKKFNAMTPTQLLDNLKQGQIGTEMDSLLSQNPSYVEAKQKLAQVQRTASLNRMGQSALGVINGKEPEDLSDLSKVEAKYNAPPGTNVAAYEQYVTNNEDVKTAGTALHNIATQISDVTKTYNEALKSLKAQYGDMPASALLTLMSTRTQDTKSLLDSLIDAKTLAQGDFDLAMKMAEGSYDAYTKDLLVQQEIEKEKRTMQNSLALSQMEFDQKIKQEAEILKTPELAIPNTIKKYEDLGIMGLLSAEQHITEFNKQNREKGTTLGEYISQMQKDFQAKESYKAKFGAKPTEAPTTKDIEVNGQKVTVQWDSTKGEWTPVQGGSIERGIATQKYGSTPAVRNFNPGNIMDTGFGGKKVEGERFTVFNSPQEGFNALVAKIQNIQNGGSKVYSPDMTLLQYISKYAPSSDGNNPKSYATAIANNLGISIDTKIGQIDPVKLAEEHARHEDGNSYKMLKDLGIIGGGTGSDVMGSFGIPFDYQNRIEQMIPVQLRNTEAEQEKLKQNVVNLYKSGISVEDAALRYMGFSPKSGTDTTKAMQLVSQARGLGEKLPENYFTNLSDYVNKGDMKGAEDYTNRVVEGVLKGELGADFISTPSLQFSKTTLDRINGFIEKNKDKIGPLSGRIADLEKQFANDSDYQALKTLLGGSLAEVRRTFGGTAVTATELGALRDFIGLDTKMPIQNLITALQTNYDTLESKYNSQRGFYGTTQTQSTAPTDIIKQTVNNLVPDAFKKYF